MSDFTTAVNRKQFFARLLVDKCRPADDPYGHAATALAESALFHLEAAYQLHLCAVAFAYKCSSPEQITTVDELVAALLAIDKSPAEAMEMQNLEQDEQSWLFAMRTASQQAQGNVIAADKPAVTISAIEKMGIPVKMVSEEEQDSALTFSRVQQWIDALDEMISRHRGMMIEC